jgi:hypothetical protein
MFEVAAALWTQASTAATTLDTQHLILQVIGVVLGGGLLQLILFLLKRRATLRSLDVASDATQLTSANEYIAVLTSDAKTLRGEIEKTKAEVAVVQRQMSIAADDHVREMAATETTITRLTTELARARTDLAVMRAELDEIAVRGAAPHPSPYGQRRTDP